MNQSSIIYLCISSHFFTPQATVDGRQTFKWNAGETVTAAAYDNPIPGFGTRNCINLRLWAAKPSKEFDLEAFNTGEDTWYALAWSRGVGSPGSITVARKSFTFIECPPCPQVTTSQPSCPSSARRP